ncbi:MAG: tRNA (N(6)-L-threonylcarbamoyladenosine(37)-C(2))-methylthiotransferase MtaB [Myxococcales bacterium]|nr:tRNA (N(6)-L-threonylcarbamoyladenosine(37)-C(2))-methylthiotransferase MtaB [Myxococcales bacterium]
MTGPRVAFHTLGCRVNQADTMALEDELRARQAVVVGARDEADIYVLNTCTVTHAADADARKFARRMKRQNPDAQVVVTGCYAQISPGDLGKMPEIDLVLGNDNKHNLADMLIPVGTERSPSLPHPAFETGETNKTDDVGAQTPGLRHSTKRQQRLWPSRVRPPRSRITSLPESRTRPFLKVQDGCDYSCAFCIIPKARGISRSFSVDYVMQQAAHYADLGAVELVLTGIHLGHWGRDLMPRVPFVEMVSDLADRLQRDGRIKRLRLGSVEPNEVTPALIALLATHPLMCAHIHVPLQAGDDDVLRSMRRLYTTDEYARVLSDLRAALPDAAIGADVLVGHPGEDERSFAKTVAFLDELDWTYLHVFPFSARKGTPSALMPDQIRPEAKSERVATLVRRSDVRRHLFHRRQVGTQREWLVLGQVGEGYNVLSRNYVPGRVQDGRGLESGGLFMGTVDAPEPSRVQVLR